MAKRQPMYMLKPAYNFLNHTFTSFSSTGQKVLQMGPSLTKLLTIKHHIKSLQNFHFQKDLERQPHPTQRFLGGRHIGCEEVSQAFNPWLLWPTTQEWPAPLNSSDLYCKTTHRSLCCCFLAVSPHPCRGGRRSWDSARPFFPPNNTFFVFSP